MFEKLVVVDSLQYQSQNPANQYHSFQHHLDYIKATASTLYSSVLNTLGNRIVKQIVCRQQQEAFGLSDSHLSNCTVTQIMDKPDLSMT